ncbi:MAG: hypothetical protein AAGC74_03760 [Verrucomicrobiota bacterium]
MLFLPARILKHVLALPSGIVFLYLGAYLMLRFLFTEPSPNGQAQLIFPADKPLLYHAFRPATYADNYLTGIEASLAKN